MKTNLEDVSKREWGLARGLRRKTNKSSFGCKNPLKIPFFPHKSLRKDRQVVLFYTVFFLSFEKENCYLLKNDIVIEIYETYY